MNTPPAVTSWFDGYAEKQKAKIATWLADWFKGYDAVLYAAPVPIVDPFDGMTPNPANGLQGLCDLTEAIRLTPPTGQEADPEYPAMYQSCLDAAEHLRRFVGYQMARQQGGGQ